MDTTTDDAEVAQEVTLTVDGVDTGTAYVGTINIERQYETVRSLGLTEIDPRWTFADSEGHVHRGDAWRETLATRGVELCHCDGDEGHFARTEFYCRECDETVEPKTRWSGPIEKSIAVGQRTSIRLDVSPTALRLLSDERPHTLTVGPVGDDAPWPIPDPAPITFVGYRLTGRHGDGEITVENP